MSGAGNLFSVIDNSELKLGKNELSRLAVILCDVNNFNKRKTEGFIAISSSIDHDFDADFYNPDGSNDAMCGNGGRCAIRFAIAKKFIESKPNLAFSMAGDVYSGKIEANEISLILPPPNEIRFNQELIIDYQVYKYSFVDVGARHLVLDYKELELDKYLREFELIDFSRKIRYHDAFAPHGVNVNIFSINSDNSIDLRTYERGVEMETGACGTGAISTALSVHKLYNLLFPLCIIPPSRIPVYVDIIGSLPDGIKSISLRGHAEIIEEIQIEIPKL
jgi:diaminopimelate epimerase